MRTLNLGVTFHSFTAEYTSYVWSFEDLMEHASKLGGGVEIVGPAHHRGFPHVSDEFETAFRSSVVRYGLTPTSYGSYADPFLRWDRALSDDELVEYTIPQIHGAARLGFPVVRLQHYAAEIVERVLPTAERLDVVLGYELHVPLDLESERATFLVEQVERIDSRHLGLIPDAGIFARSVSQAQQRRGVATGLSEETVAEVVGMWSKRASLKETAAMLEERGAGRASAEWLDGVWGSFGHSNPADLAPLSRWIVHVHGKFYSMEDGDEPDLRYRDLVFALLDNDYEGWISSEYEGEPTNSFRVVAEQQLMIRRYIDEYNAEHG